MKRLILPFLVLVLCFARSTKAELGLSIGLKGTYSIPLGKFSEIGQPYFIAGQKAARPATGFGGTFKYHMASLSGAMVIRVNLEFLQLDDKSGEYVVINESGDTLGSSNFKFRIIPITVAVQYSPLSNYSKVKPYLGLGAGVYFYSYVNSGYAGYRNPTLSEMFERNYTRFGLDFALGTELYFSKHWALDAAFGYNVVFLHRQDTIGIQSNLPALRYFQVRSTVLYSFSYY